MPISFIRPPYKTNSYYPTDWSITSNPFPAIRGFGHKYSMFVGLSKDLQALTMDDCTDHSSDASYVRTIDNKPVKFVKTAKGTNLIVPCSPEEDEHLLFLTLTSSFRGGYSHVGRNNAWCEREGLPIDNSVDELLWNSRSAHCVQTIHQLIRFNDPTKVCWYETGSQNRSSVGRVEVIGWNTMKRYSKDEFVFLAETGGLNLWQGSPEYLAKTL